MTVQAQILTPEQQKALGPKRINASGTFDARIDSAPVHFQTTTLSRNYELAVFRVNARHADNAATIKELFIQVPDSIEVGKVIKLEEQEFTSVEVWYSVKSPTAHYTVSGIKGDLIIMGLAPGVIKIRGTLHATTDADANGNPHLVEVDFNLTS
ncbi:hypothetical protein ACQRBV_23445 [Pseudomonas sp. R11F]|uniref:Uncharacterized protein n=1 Tax=Pseudomonas palleroniana TaxID=191390 RepID=A0A109FNX9_9PSED|nr:MULTISPECIES: hypothetical protein [Pseudomonas]AVE03463.1 hypothetical protein CYL20_02425 [Pseudomonas palleroniana]KWU47830.1 hypothetical protein AWV77_26305 [Pseudomonas palleroniana]NCE86781.1 hypothetical protein [Pseudomonas sp. Q1]UOK36464.1 hypothetical protein MJP36_18340 [Pseudomonas palleroniana]UOP09982.1 hypothetical protein LDL65_23290 [Pseudomonas palleroniana]